MRRGRLTAAKEWWRHLRHTKRTFWKAERKAQRQNAGARVVEQEV